MIINDVMPWVIGILKTVAPLIIGYFIIRIAATLINGYTSFIAAINTITASKGRLLFVALLMGAAIFGIYKIFSLIGW